ncbi:MAG: sugar ABC transporter permease, partial [Chloroflexota bacterium]
TIVGLLAIAMLLLPDLLGGNLDKLKTGDKSKDGLSSDQKRYATFAGAVVLILFLLVGLNPPTLMGTDAPFWGIEVWISTGLAVILLMAIAYYATESKTRVRMIPTSIALLAAVIVVTLAFFGWIVNSIAVSFILLVTLIGLIYFIPRGAYDQQQSTEQRTGNLAYALTLPTILIVFGIVVFPVVWNVIFSFRDIQVRDLQTVELFSFEGASLENYQAQVGLRFDTVPCEMEEGSSECLTDEDGNIQYVNPRRFFDDYRGWRELTGINQGDERLAIGAQDEEFYPMIFRTIFYTLASTVLAILFGLIAALIVRETFPGRAVFRGFILFPYIAPVISVAFVWDALLRQRGFINGLFGTNVDFLGTRDSFLGVAIPLLVVILFQTWRYFPFAFLFLLARLQAIPDDIYEAAKVDGAVPSQRLWFITLPQLRSVFGTLFLLRFIWTFNKFDDIFLLTGPIEQTKVIPIQIFEALFTENNVGEASAIAIIMALVLSVILAIYFRYFLVDEV